MSPSDSAPSDASVGCSALPGSVGSPVPPRLVVRRGLARGRVIELDRDRMTIGRDSRADCVLPDDIVSSLHAVFGREADGSVWVRDEGSKNGTWLNGRRLDADETITLREGDAIRLASGGPELRFTCRAGDVDLGGTSATRTVARSGSIVAMLRELLPQAGGRGAVTDSGVRRLVDERARELVTASKRSGVRWALIASALFVVCGAAAAIMVAFVLDTRGDSSQSPAQVAALSSTPWHGRLELDVRPLYGSLFHSYRERAIGTVRIEAVDALPSARLSFRLHTRRKGQTVEEGLLVEDLVEEVRGLEAGATFESSIRPKLSNAILSPVDQEVTAEVVLLRAGEPIARATRAVMIYGQNVVDWKDPLQIAAFIDPADPVVRSFVSAAWRARRGAAVDADFLPENTLKAATLLTALANLDLEYLRDGRTPTTFAGTDTIKDRVKYPGETLRERTGDCDDLAVLGCAVLEEAGVSTVFLVAPDHVLFMFESGFDPASIEDGPIDREDVIEWRGGVWIPVEATALARRGASFAAAWQEGARARGAVSSGETKAVDVADGWKEYRPLRPEPSEALLGWLDGVRWIDEETEGEIRRAIESLRALWRETLDARASELQSELGEGAALDQAIGLLYAQARLYRESCDVFKRAIFGDASPADSGGVRNFDGEIDEDRAILLEDLALATALGARSRDELRYAAACYELSLRTQPEIRRPETMLRAGFVYRLAGDWAEGAAWVARAIAADPELESVYRGLVQGDGLVAGESRAVERYLQKGFVSGATKTR